jgi:CBS domain-containing protein
MMKVERMMKRNVQCIPRGATLREAARLMRDHGVGFLPVIGPDFRVCGALTDRDVVIRAVADGRGADARVEEVMSHDVIAVRPDDPLSEAERKMTQWQKSRVMVLDADGLCCGVISLSDLASDGAPTRAATVLSSIARREAHTHTDSSFRRPRRRA